jgi:hypothetical protein
MGEFHIRIATRDGRTIGQRVIPNTLTSEGIHVLYHRLFPPAGSTVSLAMGISATEISLADRPNEIIGAIPNDSTATYARATDDGAWGGCMDDVMRDAVNYEDQAVTPYHVGNGIIATVKHSWANSHAWTPQSESAWRENWETTGYIAPHEWLNGWVPGRDPAVGFPWYNPRKKCNTTQNIDSPYQLCKSYWYDWDIAGGGEGDEHDWLCNFYYLQFPISFAYIYDATTEKIVAVSRFAAPLILWPGMSVVISYRARVFSKDGIASDLFCARFANAAWCGGSGYSGIYCRPVLATAPAMTRAKTYADYVPYFSADVAAVALSSWSADGDAIQSNAPTMTNSSGTATAGPFDRVAVFGAVGASFELMWIADLDSVVTLEHGDSLRLPSGLKFSILSDD